MPPLTDYKRVIHRAGLSAQDVDPAHVEEFIEDAQAFIEAETQHTYAASDSNFKLARAACTDLAAAYCIVRALGGSYSGLQFHEDSLNLSSQQKAKLEIAQMLTTRAESAIELLAPASTALLPRSSTS